MRGRRNLLKRKGESWEGFTIRKEGDANHFQNRHSSAISTHTLRKEGDYNRRPRPAKGREFQPTPSARRVTIHSDRWSRRSG